LDINRNVVPVAQNVRIANPAFAKVGQTLSGSYTYYDADNDTESGTTFRWLISDSQSGTYTEIDGATSKTYTVVQDDLGKYLKFEVTPKAATGLSPGINSFKFSDRSSLQEQPIIEFNGTYKTITETSANTAS
jgi:hypothetical protein